MASCKVNGCIKNARTRGYCNSHYMKQWKYGTPISPYHKADNGSGCIAGGYKKITVDGKLVPEHRHLMELKLGRKLNLNEHVHHIDGNKLNNSLNNLVVLDIHAHGHIEGLKAKGKPKISARKNYRNKCSFCGIEFKCKSITEFKSKKFCSVNCYYKDKRGKPWSQHRRKATRKNI